MPGSSSKKSGHDQLQEQSTEQPLFTKTENKKNLPNLKKGSEPSCTNDRRPIIHFLNRESSDRNSDSEEPSPFTDIAHPLRDGSRFHLKQPNDLRQEGQKTLKLNPLIPGLVKSFHRRHISDVHSPAHKLSSQNKSIPNNQSKFDQFVRVAFKPNLMGKKILNVRVVSKADTGAPSNDGTNENSKLPARPMSIKPNLGLPQSQGKPKLIATQCISSSISAKEGKPTALLSQNNPDNSSIFEALENSFNLPYFQSNYRKKKPKILNLNTSITLKQAVELEGISTTHKKRENSPGYRFL